MAQCEVCGNNYDKSFEVMQGGISHTFDSFECAIHMLAPTCAHCHCRIVGHGIEASGTFYCWRIVQRSPACGELTIACEGRRRISGHKRPAVVDQVFFDAGAAGFGQAFERVVFDVYLSVLRVDELESVARPCRPDVTDQLISVPDKSARHGRSIGASLRGLQ